MMRNFAERTAALPYGMLRDLMQKVQKNSVSYRAGSYIMTDDKAPVELLGMRVIDTIIQDEVRYYKAVYEKEGISGILNRL